MTKMAASCRLAFLFMVSAWLLAPCSAGIQVQLPSIPKLAPAVITLLRPQGIKFKVRDIPGTSFVRIEYSVTRRQYGTQTGQKTAPITSKQAYGDSWEYRDTEITVHPGDTINYWINMLIYNTDYQLLSQSWTVPGAVCNCDAKLTTGECYASTTQCICKSQYSGTNCTRCSPGYSDYPHCIECTCNGYGTKSSYCQLDRKECICKSGFNGTNCDRCSTGYDDFPLCVQNTVPTTMMQTITTTANPDASDRKLHIIIGVLAACLVIVIAIVITVIMLRRRRSNKKNTVVKRKNGQIIEFDYEHGRSADSLVRDGYVEVVPVKDHVTYMPGQLVNGTEHNYERPLPKIPTSTSMREPDYLDIVADVDHDYEYPVHIGSQSHNAHSNAIGVDPGSEA